MKWCYSSGEEGDRTESGDTVNEKKNGNRPTDLLDSRCKVSVESLGSEGTEGNLRAGLSAQ